MLIDRYFKILRCYLIAWSLITWAAWWTITAFTALAITAWWASTVATATAEAVTTTARLKDLSLGWAEGSWGSISWKAKEVAEVLNSLVSKGIVSMSPSIVLHAEALGNEGAADLEWVDVEAIKLLVGASLVVRDDHNAVLEEVTEDSPADGSWHIHVEKGRP